MFDKVIIKACIDVDDIDTIVLRNYLEQCTEGDELFYKSTAYANFDGCFIEVRGNQLKCKCSINKLYEKERSGKLDNSKPMTFRNAVIAGEIFDVFINDQRKNIIGSRFCKKQTKRTESNK